MNSLLIHLAPGTPAFAQYKARAKEHAVQWAQKTLAIPADNWCLLDTETAGLDQDAEVIQVGLTDGAGNILMNNVLCKPSMPIPPDATAIHHITNEMVMNSPNFLEVHYELVRLTEGRVVVIYNKAYDLRLIRQSLMHFSNPLPFAPARVECAMLQYADYVGDWNEYHQNFKWPKLAGGDHSAVGDCLATLEVIKKMAQG
jgi:DNA polymerase-3 subunit epsilon